MSRVFGSGTSPPLPHSDVPEGGWRLNGCLHRPEDALARPDRLLLRVTAGDGGTPGCFFFFLTYNCHCFDCRAITCTCLRGTIDALLAVKAQKPPTRYLVAKHPLCRVNLSLDANLSLIIGSWHLWRGREIDSGGWVGAGVDCLGSRSIMTHNKEDPS